MEQERRSLLARVDELVAEKLTVSTPNYCLLDIHLTEYPALQYTSQTAHSSYYTPGPKYTNSGEPSTSSSTTKRASSAYAFQSNSAHNSGKPTSSSSEQDSPSDVLQKQTRRSQKAKSSGLRPQDDGLVHREQSRNTPGSKGTKNPVADSRVAQHEPRAVTQSRVIRRVQAVISIPVKEEDEDDEIIHESVSADASPSTAACISPEVPEIEALHPQKPTSSTRQKPRKHSRRVVSDDDDDELEDEDQWVPTPSEDEEEDPLMMGAEVSVVSSRLLPCNIIILTRIYF